MSGINIKDNGPKMGYVLLLLSYDFMKTHLSLRINGVDNGRIWFRNVKIPKDNLLDKFCTIDKDGKYSSPIKNPVVRFATMIGGLVSGRILIAAAGVDGAKIALANAILYSVQRKQFGDVPGKGMQNLDIFMYLFWNRGAYYELLVSSTKTDPCCRHNLCY
jgi:acyl-CoA oxidase